MRIFDWMGARKRATASVAGVAVVSLSIATMATLYSGFATENVDLNDGGVWVTKAAGSVIGHLNYESKTLDNSLYAPSPNFDVLQDGDTVLMHDLDGSTVSTIDPVKVSIGSGAVLPANATVEMGGTTVAILDPSNGGVYVTTAATVDSFTPEGVKPVAKLGVGAAIGVGTDGTVFGVSRTKGTLTTIGVDSLGRTGAAATSSLHQFSSQSTLSITTVGDQPVVLDANAKMLYLPGGRTASVSGDSPTLQQGGADSDTVLVETATSLVAQPLAGGSPSTTSIDTAGTTAPPVYLNGCGYAVWSGTAQYVRDCVGTSDDTKQIVPGVAADAHLTFRVNRSVVVLNNISNGDVFLVNQNMVKVDNWDEVTPQTLQDGTDPNDSTKDTLEDTPADRTKKNSDPVANPDTFGVRPGRSTILPVVDNDTDPDGDLLTATLDGNQPSIGDVAPVYGGAAMQITVPSDATGTASFSYTLSDGRGGTAKTTVALKVRQLSDEAAPEQQQVPSVEVEQGATIDFNVLPSFLDPDGDDVFLQDASSKTDGDVTFTADGVVSFTASGSSAGVKQIALVVSDGTETARGTLEVKVKPVGTGDPITNADLVTAHTNESITVSPLANDVSPTGATLRLAKVDEAVAPETIVTDLATGTFSFAASAPGSYYVNYSVVGPHKSVAGFVRVDVTDPTTDASPPIAVRDVGLLVSGRSALVDVLANDSDPSGGVLVVTSATPPAGSGLVAAVLEHSIVRISAKTALTAPVLVSYTISNGAAPATGEILVIPVPASSTPKPPIAVDDDVTVRAGDIATIPVLANDRSQNGGELTLVPKLVEAPAATDGLAFVSENKLRFRAGAKAKDVSVTYAVQDSVGEQTDSGYVTIHILAADAASDTPPRPQSLVARVIAGSSVRIPVPLDGIDPDGDSVQLFDLPDQPTKGAATITDGTSIEYVASPGSSGTDVFTYRVRDRLGSPAIATVRVGIAPPSASNSAPDATPDSITVKPNVAVAVPALANDSDPDGDQLTLKSGGLTVPDGLKAEVTGDRVVVHTTKVGQFSLQYTVADSHGSTAIGTIAVTVTDDATSIAPTARDDYVSVADISGKTTVSVPVLKNDDDLDGVTSDLKVSVTDPSAVVGAGGTVRVEVTTADQIITYTDTDVDGLTASAFILVPGTKSQYPTLNPTAPKISVKSGVKVTVDIADYVIVAAGKKALITEAAKVTATNSDGSSPFVDGTHVQFTSAKNFYGSASVSFEVTDAKTVDDPAGLKSTISVPITVTPGDNQPPTFVGAAVSVAPKESAETVDLSKLATDPDAADKLSFSIVGQVPSDLTAKLSGATLSVAAADGAKSGSTASIGVAVNDGHDHTVKAAISVKVVASKRPLPVAVNDTVTTAKAGDVLTVDVLANDTNPFPGSPLLLSGVTSPSSGGKAEQVGTKIKVSIDPTFSGTMTINYTVRDTLNSPDRQAQGTLTVVVKSKPDAPGRPTTSDIGDQTAVLSWNPPQNNGGSPITGYTVSAVGGGYSKVCSSTTCTLDGLKNNTTYTFTVTATNAVGVSDASPASDAVRPDKRPDTPAAPTLVFGDGSLAVSWAAPASSGSPIQSYSLEISPAPSSGSNTKTGVTGTSLTWDGLDNGTAYQVRVQAYNLADKPSDFSSFSATMIPAGKPAQPAAPATTSLAPVGGQAQMKVSWTKPAINGDEISSYTVTVQHAGSADRAIKVAGTETSTTATVDTSTTNYTFTVVATNKAGDSPVSAPSAAVRGYTPPGAPSNVVAAPGDGKVSVTWTAGAGNGSTDAEISYRYSINGGAFSNNWASGGTGTSGVISAGIANNNSYKIAIKAVSSLGNTDGDPSAQSNSVAPFGPVGNPSVIASNGNDRVNFSWSGPARNGRDFSTDVRVDGNLISHDGSGSYAAVGWSQTHTMTVTVTDSEGSTQTASASASSNAPPAESLTITQDSAHWILLQAANFAPNRSLTIACYVVPGADGQGGRSIGSFTVKTDANGGGSWGVNQTCTMTGGGYGNLHLGNEVWSNTILLN